MKVIIRSFGLPPEVLESDWFDLELPEGATVGDLTKVMGSRYPQLFGMRRLALFINGENVTEDVALHEGDQAFFSPIVGGG